MKKYILLGIALINIIMLTSCSCYDSCFLLHKQADPARENWMRQMNSDPNQWTQHADSWFFNGEPNKLEQAVSKAPATKAITILSVRVPQFTHIVTNGSFQVQLVGGQKHNSVFIIGPNSSTQQISVRNKNNTLYVYQAKENKANLCNTIVRIGIRNLHQLRNLGSSTIYGRNLLSDYLNISSSGSGNTMLAGRFNLANVTQAGSGTVTIMGVYSPTVYVQVHGNGNVNISGRVGVQSVIHNGNGRVNIIGADSDSLSIHSAGSGTTAIAGYVNLQKVIAINQSRVELFWVDSSAVYVQTKETAHVSLAGKTKTLIVDSAGSSRFEGEYLHSNIGYVKTLDRARANVFANQSMFASAQSNSNIYFFGPENILTRGHYESGNIIPMSNGLETLKMPTVTKTPWIPFSSHSYKGEQNHPDKQQPSTDNLPPSPAP